MSATLLPGVDRAAFAVALERALRSAGVAVSLNATADLVAAFRHRFPLTRDELYWLARITLVSTESELSTFEEVFASIFDDAVVRLDPNARRTPPAPLPEEQADIAMEAPDDVAESSSTALPWVLPREISIGDDQSEQTEHQLPELRASAARAHSDLPFGELSDGDMRRLASWVQDASQWPTRMSRRTRRDERGRRVAMRHTLAAARRTGYEPLSLVRENRRRRPRRIVMICDVSQSMQSVAAAHLHLMRAMARHRNAEVFAFSTELTRLTPTLRATTPLETLDVAAHQLDDRLGGTRIATSLRALLESHHGGLLRGAVVMIASDGWDSDDPTEMARVMERIGRRAHAVIWLNPRAAAPGFTPATGALLAALPHCRLMLPAGSFDDLRTAMIAVQAAAGRGTGMRASSLTSTR
ncbi:MAG: VWA domain-containing protein [Dermatophilaceae bacterium]